MTDTAQPPAPSKPALWIGRVLSGLFILFMIMDCTIKLLDLDVVKTASTELGFPVSLDRLLGSLEFIGLVLYAIPRTSVLGGIILTGYLGGAIAAHLRVNSPTFTHTLFGLYLGLIAWGGLYLRNSRLRRLLPLDRTAVQQP